MRVDPHRIAEAHDWLRRALSDLESAEILLEAAPSHPDTAVFHTQQVAEKSWKALLFWHDVPFRRTHDLRELGRDVTQLDSSLSDRVEQAEDLTQFAWIFRYPGSSQVPTTEEARGALVVAKVAYAAALERLPEAAHP